MLERRMIRWHLKRSQLADHALRPERYRVDQDPIEDVQCEGFGDRWEAWHWFAANRRTLLSMIESATLRGWHFEAWSLAEAMWSYLEQSTDLDDAELTYRMACYAAGNELNREARIHLLLMLGELLIAIGSFADAKNELSRAWVAARNRGSSAVTVMIAGALARTAWAQGSPVLAADWINQGLSISAASVAPDIEALRAATRLRSMWARYLRHQGRPREAAAAFEAARDEFQALGDWPAAVDAERWAATILQELGDPGAAERLVSIRSLEQELKAVIPDGWHGLDPFDPAPNPVEPLHGPQSGEGSSGPQAPSGAPPGVSVSPFDAPWPPQPVPDLQPAHSIPNLRMHEQDQFEPQRGRLIPISESAVRGPWGWAKLTVQGRRRHGRKRDLSLLTSMFLAGFIFAALGLGGGVLIGLTSGGAPIDPPTDDMSSGAPTGAPDCDLQQPGADCVEDPTCFVGYIVTLSPAACSAPHRWEAYATGPLPEDIDDGDIDAARGDERIASACIDGEREGGPLSRLIGSDAAAWTTDVHLPGDGTFMCVAARADGTETEGSAFAG